MWVYWFKLYPNPTSASLYAMGLKLTPYEPEIFYSARSDRYGIRFPAATT